MCPNILVTGAAGYIGGSILAELIASSDTLIPKSNIVAAVKSHEQAEALAELGVNVVQLDLADEESVISTILKYKINIAIQNTSVIDARIALHLIAGLSKQKEISGEQVFLIHTSGMASYYAATGWTHGHIKDSGSVYELEKESADSFPGRKTAITTIDEAEAKGVIPFVIPPPIVYGKGLGVWNQLSLQFPGNVRASIADKVVHKFANDTRVSAVHITDLVALYKALIEKIVAKKTDSIPKGKKGYYFPIGHDIIWWEFLDHLATALYARGLVTDPEVKVWESDEVAGKSIDFPAAFVQAFWNDGPDASTENSYKLGWKPQWNKTRLLENIDDEIDAVLELRKAKSSLLDSLRNF